MELDITAKTTKGNEYKVAQYEDPAPGKVGTDRIQQTCYRCLGKGVVDYGNVTFVAKGYEDRHCFTCLGKGYTTVLVSSLRSTARRQIKAENIRRAEQADWEAEAPAREAAELEAAHEEALRMNAALDAKPKGFLGTEGERLRNLNARIVMIRQYESTNFVTGAPEYKTIVKFDVLGKTAIWFTSYTTQEEGDMVSLTGTVKKLNTRDGEDQTVLTRCIIK